METTGTLWHIAQNVPLIVLLVSGVWHWARQKQVLAVGCTAAGALVSSLLIHSTKPMANDYSEPWGVTVVTVVSMSLLQGLLTAYLGTEAEWSNWKVDIGLGSLTGASFAVAQGLAPPGSLAANILLHGIGLGVASILLLLGMRRLKEKSLTTAVVAGLLMGVAVTLLFRAMGYQLVLE